MMTREDVKSLLGPVDDSTVAQVVEAQAERAELIEALAWMASDDARADVGNPRPSGAVSRVLAALRPQVEAMGMTTPMPPNDP